MYASQQRERAYSALASAAVVALIGWALVVGLQPAWIAAGPGALLSVSFAPPPPPEPRKKEEEKPQVRPTRASAPKGAPAPRGLRNEATQVVAPPVPIVILPPPVVTAPVAGIGSAASQGASDLPGPGQGAGGIGNGFGGGGRGGNGNGDGSGEGTEPRQIRGRLSSADLPDGAVQPGSEVSVGVRYTVGVDGRVSACEVDKPSGIAQVDAVPCRLIMQRFRFRPALDRAGRPVSSTIVETHTWVEEPTREQREEFRRRG